MKRFFGKFFATIGILATLLIAVPLLVGWYLKSDSIEIPPQTFLTIDLSQPISDSPETDPWQSLFMPPQPNLLSLVRSIHHAKSDPKISGIVLDINHLSIGMAQLDEIRQALVAFRKSGKPIYAYSDSFGDLSPSLIKYFFASIADKIWSQPFSGLNLTGLHIDQPYFGKLLDHLDVKRQIYQRSAYKNAFSSLVNEKATQDETDAMEHLLSKIFTYVSMSIEASRELGEGMILNISKSVPMLSDEKAVELNLIDETRYKDEFLEMVLSESHPENASQNIQDQRTTKQIKKLPSFLSHDQKETIFKNEQLVDLGTYALSLRSKNEKKPQQNIAVIYASGPITADDESRSFIDRSLQANSRRLERYFDMALSDPNTRAIVLRIDSPGGSAVASETIRRLVLIAKQRKIPVIASLGNYAASGGYWIASPCDKILASALTITGSIGAIGGKISIREALEHFDINVSSFQTGDNGSLWSPLSAYNEAQDGMINETLDRLYARFVTIVAEGRNLTLQHVSEIAKGRVWSGQDALQFGLIDQFGGILDAINMASQLAGATDANQMSVVEYPNAKTINDKFSDFLGGEISMFSSLIRHLQQIVMTYSILTSKDVQLIDHRPYS